MKVLAQDVTEIECTANFKPITCLVNSGNLGFARVQLDDNSIQYFLKNIGNIEDQLDRTYMWMILKNHVHQCKVHPEAFVDCFIKNFSIESD